jgi:hypothetical protein
MTILICIAVLLLAIGLITQGAYNLGAELEKIMLKLDPNTKYRNKNYFIFPPGIWYILSVGAFVVAIVC